MRNSLPSLIKITTFALFECLAGPTIAEPIDALPLQRGFYVDSTIPCAGADNSSLLLVTREGINSAQAECKISQIDKTGPTTFVVTGDCMELSSGSALGEAITTYAIPNDHTFGYDSEGAVSGLSRFCPQSELPEPFSTNDISDLLD